MYASIRRRITMLCLTMLMLAAAIAVRLAYLISVPNYQETARQQGTYTIRTPITYANLYDANFQKLVNDTVQQIAVINPTTEAVTAILPYVQDKEAFYENLQYGTPVFLCCHHEPCGLCRYSDFFCSDPNNRATACPTLDWLYPRWGGRYRLRGGL